jgi:hypothetical protein
VGAAVALRRDRATVGEQVPRVVEADDAVAQEVPALLGMAGHDAGSVAVGCISGRAARVVMAPGVGGRVVWAVLLSHGGALQHLRWFGGVGRRRNCTIGNSNDQSEDLVDGLCPISDKTDLVDAVERGSPHSSPLLLRLT